MLLVVFLFLEKVAVRLAELEDEVAFVILAFMEERDVFYSFHDSALNARFGHLQMLRSIDFDAINSRVYLFFRARIKVYRLDRWSMILN